MEEVEQYVIIQEEHYADQMSQLVLKKIDMHTEYEQHKEQLDLERNELAKMYNALEAKYEEQRLALLVEKAKVMFDQGSAEARLAEMRKELTTMQCKVSHG